jgi:hypothetical protein
MPAFFEYLRNITYYLLFASLIGMAAPAGKYRQYVKLTTGFILLLLIIKPLAAFTDGLGVPVTEWFTASPVIYTGAEYGAVYDEALSLVFEGQLRNQLAQLLSQNDYELIDADFFYNLDYTRLESIFVTVRRKPDKKTPFIRIEPVRIGAAESTAESEVKKLISGFYSLEAGHIHVKVQE